MKQMQEIVEIHAMSFQSLKKVCKFYGKNINFFDN